MKALIFNMISSQHLTHKHPAWQGCTMAELLTLALGILSMVIVMLSIIGFAVGRLSIVGMGALPLTFGGMRIAAPRYATSKHGKPHGYLMIQLRRCIGQYSGGFFKGFCPYENRTGFWSTESTIESSYQKDS
jgi:conjugative transfer region protein (TIGR03750 family)